MVIKVVDLGCEKCHKKIKKILCKIPQIQSQIYVEEKNTVTITVVCCSPEKIKKKILGKGCGFIECVEIKPPSPPPETKPSSPKPTSPETKPSSPKPTPPIKHEVNVKIQSTCCHLVFRGKMVFVAAEEGVTLCVSVKIIHRNAQSCKGGGKLRIPMIGASVQHQPLDSNPVVMMDS
ncbi:HEAVY METAL TRANSPORT/DETOXIFICATION SUPERFAMILY PROTEIN [Salix viminalis]|uniref:HEAVY METAL TRANSPORT/DETOXIFICATION SUPERFAMILY PROTEIN n=1 Tax=Salix viminalis TaxID=40686 RepID=A0A9Q0V4E1_SALVM|nr:HEAVY METAL TRANSPORT/DETOXIFICATION SUPERFAMILY PROTEIN [Salix viminalis]